MFKRLIASVVCLCFIFSSLQPVFAQEFSVNQLPVPGAMVETSSAFTPLALKGIVVNPQKPLEFQFIVDTGLASKDTAAVKEQANELVKYFLAGLTIPEGDLWVNLSPYEKDRMTTESLGATGLGRDLLAQDYILKQLTASMIYPEKDLGKEFWSRVYKKSQEQFGTTNIPVNTFNKVWILPNQAQVFEHGPAAYVTQSTLKVMLDEDYLALQKQKVALTDTNSIGANIVRQIVIPEIEKEVNTGKNFAPLRQIYQALILAKWYKETIQNGLLDAAYTNKSKIKGINLTDPAVKEQIYSRYLEAYKKGVFNYIKDDATPNGQTAPKKYFSGGLTPMPKVLDRSGDAAMISAKGWVVGALMLLVVSCSKREDVALKDPDGYERYQAIEEMYKEKDKNLIPVLIKSLKDPDEDVSKLAAKYLGEIGDKTAVPALIELFKNTYPRTVAYETLQKFGKSAVPGLIEILRDKSPRIVRNPAETDYALRFDAIELLGKIGDQSAVPALLEAATEFKISRYQVARALKQLGLPLVSEILSELNDASGINAQLINSFAALELRGDKTAISAFIDSLKFLKQLRSYDSMRTVATLMKLKDKTIAPAVIEKLIEAKEYSILASFLESNVGFYESITDMALAEYVEKNLPQKSIQESFNQPGISRLIQLIDSWSDEDFKKYFPMFIQPQHPYFGTDAARSYSSIIGALKLAELAKRSDRVKRAIRDGLLQYPNIDTIVRLPKTVYADFKWSGAPSIPFKVPEVYLDGELLNKDVSAAEQPEKADKSMLSFSAFLALPIAQITFQPILADVDLTNVIQQWISDNPWKTGLGVLAITYYLWSKFTLRGIIWAITDEDTKERDIKKYLAKQNYISLVKLLNDNSIFVSRYAVERLGELKDDRAVKPLIKFIKEESNRSYYYSSGAFLSNQSIEAAVKALGELGSKSAIEPLFGLIEIRGVEDVLVKLGASKEQIVNAYIAVKDWERVGRLGDKRAVDPLIASLKGGLFFGAINILGELGDKSAIEPLIELLDSPSAVSDVERALSKLGVSNEQLINRYMEVLAIHYESSDWTRTDPRINAARKLAELGHKQAIKPLLDLLKGFTEYSTIEESLEELGATREQMFSAYLAALSEGSGDARRNAIKKLEEFGDKRALEPLVDKITTWRDDYDGQLAAKAILKIGGYEYENVLRELLNKQPNHARGILLRFFKQVLEFRKEGYNFKVIFEEQTGHDEQSGENMLTYEPTYTFHVDIPEVLRVERGEKLSDQAMLQTPKPVTGDKAQLANYGGIDLNQIYVNRTGKTIKVEFDPAQLSSLLQGGFEGFSPVIISITPIQSPYPLLGLEPRKEQELMAKV